MTTTDVWCFAGYQSFPAQQQAAPQTVPAAIAAAAAPGTQPHTLTTAAANVSLAAAGQLQVATNPAVAAVTAAVLGFPSGQPASNSLAPLPAAVGSSSLVTKSGAEVLGPSVCIQGASQVLSQPTNGSCRTSLLLSAPASLHSRATNGYQHKCGTKRKLVETPGGESTQGEGADSGVAVSGSEVRSQPCQPLYCRVCRVTLNAPAQAKQHYEGKTHAKKAKLYADAQAADKLTASAKASQVGVRAMSVCVTGYGWLKIHGIKWV